jgi:hypothetical protein
MKKLLGILVLGLFLSGNAHTEAVFTQQEIDKEIKYMNEFYNQKVSNSKNKLCVLAQSKNIYETIWGYACGPKDLKDEIIKAALKECQAEGENCVITKHGNQIVNKVAEKISTEVSGNLKFTTSIGKHKNTCKELGFTPGTEKFGDCALKLIELEVAQQGNNKAAQQIQIIKQEPAYDGWMGELGLSILRGDFNKKVQQPAYRFPETQTSTCRWFNAGIGQPYMKCTTN